MKVKSSFGEYSVTVVSSTSELEQGLSDYEFRGVIIDSVVAQKYWPGHKVLDHPNVIEVDANENSKQYSALERVFDWLAESKFDRRAQLLAIGGGVVQDIATFVSATFHRGIPWTYVPTTLLSQADSCIGGKCGINLGGYKNQVGLVYPPTSILANSAFLAGLSNEDLIGGMGEILKIAVTGENQFWSEYCELVSRRPIWDLDFPLLTERALQAKKYVVEKDEMELDYRRVLNYGHTLGHAIEAASDFAISHGIGVILGIKAISKLGVKWGVTPQGLAGEVIEQADTLLRQSTTKVAFSTERAVNLVRHDKKTLSGRATFVVLEEPGSHRFVSKNLDDELFGQIAQVLDELKS